MTLEQNLHHSAHKKGLSGKEEERYVGGAIENMRKKGKLPSYGFRRGRKSGKLRKQEEESARKAQEIKQQEYAARIEKEQHARDLRELSNARRRVHGMVQSAKKYHPDVEAEGKRLVEAGKLKGDESTMTKKDYDAWIRFFHKHRIYT